MLCAISSLNLVSPLGAWSFRHVLQKTVVFCDYLPLGQPPPARLFQLNALPDPPAPAGVQQVVEPAQNPPQELEPIAEPAPAPAAPGEVNLFLFLLRFMQGLGLLRFCWRYFSA